MFVPRCSDKKKEICLNIDPSKERKTSQNRTLHLDPQRAGGLTIQINVLSWLSEIVRTFQNIHLSGTYIFQNEGE